MSRVCRLKHPVVERERSEVCSNANDQLFTTAMGRKATRNAQTLRFMMDNSRRTRRVPLPSATDGNLRPSRARTRPHWKAEDLNKTCSWLTREEPGVVVYCDVSRCFPAHGGRKKRDLYELPGPVGSFSSDPLSTRRFRSQDCRSLDVFCFFRTILCKPCRLSRA